MIGPRFLFLLLALCTCINPGIGSAQGENNIWAFGDSSGLDFNSGSPVAIKTAIFSRESSATICDASGHLLFYCGSDKTYRPCVWDKTNNLMPNGTGLLGNFNTSGEQGTCIIPFKDGTPRYYLFLQSDYEDWVAKGQSYLRYSVIDMSLRGGLGDVVAGRKDIIIDSFTSEKMSVGKGLDCSIWLIVHRWDTCIFHAFRIDGAGLHTTPVSSGFSSIPRSSALEQPYFWNGMDLSQDSKMLADTRSIAPYDIELYDFNSLTGVISNKRIIDGAPQPYWLQFSPDGSKLYTTGPITQYDLSLLPSLSAVKASRYMIRDTADYSGMRIGPDGKIYTLTGYYYAPKTLASIDYPDKAGAACGFNKIMDLATVNGFTFGLNIIPAVRSDSAYTRRDTAICFRPDIVLKASPGYTSYTWADGSTQDSIRLSAPGKTWVKMFKECRFQVDTINVSALPADTLIHKTDTVICFSGPVKITAPAGDQWLWEDGDTSRSHSYATGGTHWVRYYSGTCTVSIDTFHLTASIIFDTSYHVHDTIVCLMNPVTLQAAAGYEHYKWQDGNTSASNNINTAGTYWVRSTLNCAVLSDTFHVTAQTVDTVTYHRDTVICFADHAEITDIPGYAVYEWSDGSTASSTIYNNDGSKWVAATNKDCKLRIDTIQVRFIDFRVNLPDMDTICGSSTLILDATTAEASYLWQDGSTGPRYTVTQAGAYTVKISVSPCSLTHTTNISTRTFTIDIGPDQQLCQGKDKILSPGLSGADYLWQDGSNQNSFTASQSGSYWVTVTEGSCTASDTIQLQVIDCTNCMVIPNAFTPNGDQHNDIFRPLIRCPLLIYNFKIYNRYGQEIFSSNNPLEGWDGRFNGQREDLGTYYYLIKVHFDAPGAQEEYYKGDVTLVR